MIADNPLADSATTITQLVPRQDFAFMCNMMIGSEESRDCQTITQPQGVLNKFSKREKHSNAVQCSHVSSLENDAEQYKSELVVDESRAQKSS